MSDNRQLAMLLLSLIVTNDSERTLCECVTEFLCMNDTDSFFPSPRSAQANEGILPAKFRANLTEKTDVAKWTRNCLYSSRI